MVVSVKIKNAPPVAPQRKYTRVKTKTLTRASAPAAPVRTVEVKNGTSVSQGTRIHAQRKFAQGANVCSPAATPVKETRGEGRLRKRVLSPIPPFPASKRPKTEDFLTFLCYRGTPVLPPDLDFFNFNPVVEKKDEVIKSVKPLSLSEKNGVQEGQSGSQGTSGAQSSSQAKSKEATSSSVSHKLAQKTPQKEEAKREEALSKSMNKLASKQINSSKKKAVVKQTGKLPIVQNVALSKAKKKKSTVPILPSPPKPSRINEQDARFAMTALKLKYQEKRLAKTKPALSVISMITKKVKERSVILTRSKSKTVEKSPPKSGQASKPKVVKSSKAVIKVQSRNAPSPDIIYGVTHTNSKSFTATASSGNSSSSSESESDSEPVVRSLRNGKAFVMKPNPAKPTVRKIAAIRRMGTRASQRSTKSPLRELPMYAVKKRKKKKFVKKIKPKQKKKEKEREKEKDKSKRKESSPEQPKERTSAKKDGKSEGSPRRRMRKTKEMASIFLGLLKGFSSDDDDLSGDNRGNSSEGSGNSSSSETKFLEKQYNASLKRIEQKGKNPAKEKSKLKLTTNKQVKGSNSTISKTKSIPMAVRKRVTKEPVRPIKPKSPEKRILRSQSTRSEKGTKMKEKILSPKLLTRRRLTLPMATCDRRAEGAARKTASVGPRKRSNFSSSSSSSNKDTDSDSDSESSSRSSSNVSSVCSDLRSLHNEVLVSKSDEVETEKPLSTKLKSPQGSNKDDSESNGLSSDSEVDERKESCGSEAEERKESCGSEAEEKKESSESEIEEKKESSESEVEERKESSDSEVEEKKESSPSEDEDGDAKMKSIDSVIEESILATTVVEAAITTSSISEESKSIATEMRRLVEQKRAVEGREKCSSSADDEGETSSSDSESNSSSTTPSLSPSSSSSSDEENEEEPPKPKVEKTSIAIQVDMDIEEGVEMANIYCTETSASITHTHLTASTSTHHQNINMSYMPDLNLASQPHFIPYSRPDFYQSLHMAPPIMSSIQLVGGGNPDFTMGPPHHLNIPVSLPVQTFGNISGPRVLTPSPLCFSSTSISTAATLQTHIRSVAANLDIPLVRPIVGADNPLNFPFPVPRSHVGAPHVSSTGSHSHSHISMTRPLTLWSGDGRAHYSAFRVPLPAGKMIQSSVMSTQMGMGSVLPLSIVHPQQHQLQMQQPPQQLQLQQHPQQQQPTSHHLPVSIRSVSNMIPHSTSVTISGTQLPATSAQSQGFSILQNLPNVSIVPRFDRNSKTVVIPPTQTQTSSSSCQAKESSSKQSKSRDGNNSNTKKEKSGGKKRKQIVIPQPPSPLTVRKDSTNPVTYVGISAKKNQKSLPNTTPDPKEPRSDPFNKLLQLKNTTEPIDVEEPCRSPPSRISTATPTESSEKHSKSDENCSSSSGGSKHSDKVKEKATKDLQVQEVPAFYPDEDQFQDPLKYIEGIRKEAEKFGMARIVPPRCFRPECNVEDDMRFTAYNHYIHKMFKRWGPNVHETASIKEHLRKSNVDVSSPPILGGMEVDLSTLYHTVQSFGGLKEVIEKQKWHKVSDAMHIPKAANDRATKLDGIYVKYVLPFEMLSEGERKKLMNQVEERWKNRQKRLLQKGDGDNDSDSEEDPLEELDDCVVKGKSTPLSAYYRVARNTLSLLFQGKEPSCSEIETEYWKMVRERIRHLCVYSGSIDCAGVGWGFPLPKAASKHPWNLKVLANSHGSALRSMGSVMGTTVPTLHMAMVFTTYCWYRDPHALPWIEYLHSGANKIWYSIPGTHEDVFRKALNELMPLQCRRTKKIWLASDSAMVPPEMLLSKGIPLARAVQKPGEFLVVFPKSFTSAVCTGYLVSESVCFAPPAWLHTCLATFKDIRDSKEPPVFALEKLLLSILLDTRGSVDTLQIALPLMEEILKEEYSLRKKLLGMGLSSGKMGPNPDKVAKKKNKREEDHVHQCDTCNYILHLSLVSNKVREFELCLPHAVQHLSKNKSHVRGSVILFDHSEDELQTIVQGSKSRLEKRPHQ